MNNLFITKLKLISDFKVEYSNTSYFKTKINIFTYTIDNFVFSLCLLVFLYYTDKTNRIITFVL